MRILLVVAVCVAEIVFASAARKGYENHKVIRVVPQNDRQVRFLRKLHDSGLMQLDFWTYPNGHHNVDIRVSPTEKPYLDRMLRRTGLTSTILVNDIQQHMDTEYASMVHTPQQYNSFMCEVFGINCDVIVTPETPGGNEGQVVGRYARHGEINNWLDQIASSSNGLASVSSIGSSYEGRDMKLIKISTDSGNSAKPIIWIEAGIHAREWIAPATAVSTINKLITEYGVDADATAMLDAYDFHILPVANPDGYEYTFTNERLWRKTRSVNPSSSCRGVDPNRNFDISFAGAGTSQNPCSDTYCGQTAFSERETANIRDEILKSKDRIKAFLSFHAYSQLLLIPYGYTAAKPSDITELKRVADRSMSALKDVHGKTFGVGAPPDILYSASGGTYDWAKVKAGIKYSYTYELRPSGAAGDTEFGTGFVLSEQAIQPSSEEVWASLVSMAQDMI